MCRQKKSPAVGSGAIPNNNRGTTTISSLPASANIGTLTPAQERFDQAYALLVTGRATRRHIYFNLPSAQKAIDRARARGADAELMLVRITVEGSVIV